MAGLNHSQVSVQAGELSPRMHGRVDLELYGKGLRRCENMKPCPQGPALMRAGSVFHNTWPEASEHPRLFAFRQRSYDYEGVLAIGATRTRIYSRVASAPMTNYPTLIANGGFDAKWQSLAAPPGWSQNVGGRTALDYGWEPGGSAFMTSGTTVTEGYYQAVPTVIGHTYYVRFRHKSVSDLQDWRVYIDGVFLATSNSDTAWAEAEFSFTATGASTTVLFTPYTTAPGSSQKVWLDDVAVYDALPGQADWPSGFTAGGLPKLQFGQERGKTRSFIACQAEHPRVLVERFDRVYDYYAMPYDLLITPWYQQYWPSAVEVGYQGRVWFANNELFPAGVWGSQSGDPFNFDPGTGLDNESIWDVVSTKGEIRWLHGQRVMFLGAEMVEHILHSTGPLITTADHQYEDVSAYGSAPIQACHIGDQVLFVTGDRRRVRALDYSWEKQTWYSRAITWAAESVIDSDIVELHFSRNPDPTIFAVLASGELRGCTYDRTENIAAWWRISLPDATVHSACVTRTAQGDELWLSLTRTGSTYDCLEYIPLYDTGVGFLDSSVTTTVPPSGVIPYFGHLIGKTVRVIVDGALLPDQVVDGSGNVTVDSSLAGKTFTIGLPYVATLHQLPLEGGLATGSSQTAKRRKQRVRLRLNNSAIPLVDGYRAAERAPADPMDTPTDLITGDVDVQLLGWEDDGGVLITQDLPFRTEVLAVFSNAQTNEV